MEQTIGLFDLTTKMGYHRDDFEDAGSFPVGVLQLPNTKPLTINILEFFI